MEGAGRNDPFHDKGGGCIEEMGPDKPSQEADIRFYQTRQGKMSVRSAIEVIGAEKFRRLEELLSNTVLTRYPRDNFYAHFSRQGNDYVFGGIVNPNRGWHPLLQEIADLLKEVFGDDFLDATLAAYGGDGAWHRDVEMALRDLIVSISLGASARFQMKEDKKTVFDEELKDGDMMVLFGNILHKASSPQPDKGPIWSMAVEGESRPVGISRIAITFRVNMSPEAQKRRNNTGFRKPVHPHPHTHKQKEQRSPSKRSWPQQAAKQGRTHAGFEGKPPLHTPPGSGPNYAPSQGLGREGPLVQDRWEGSGYGGSPQSGQAPENVEKGPPHPGFPPQMFSGTTQNAWQGGPSKASPSWQNFHGGSEMGQTGQVRRGVPVHPGPPPQLFQDGFGYPGSPCSMVPGGLAGGPVQLEPPPALTRVDLVHPEAIHSMGQGGPPHLDQSVRGDPLLQGPPLQQFREGFLYPPPPHQQGPGGGPGPVPQVFRGPLPQLRSGPEGVREFPFYQDGQGGPPHPGPMPQLPRGPPPQWDSGQQGGGVIPPLQDTSMQSVTPPSPPSIRQPPMKSERRVPGAYHSPGRQRGEHREYQRSPSKRMFEGRREWDGYGRDKYQGPWEDKKKGRWQDRRGN